MRNKINNSELKEFFYEKELLKAVGRLAKSLLKQNIYTKKALLPIFEEISNDPEKFLESDTFSEIAQLTMELQPSMEEAPTKYYKLREEGVNFAIFGEEHIAQKAIEQMKIATKLPISISGALMPDAHLGYGLPIGGVLATSKDAIIPYAVGVDIACRMCLSVFEMDGIYLPQKKAEFKNYLRDHTNFGMGGTVDDPLEDEIWEHPDWNATGMIQKLMKKAMSQVGSSGTGNHFVEWGILDILEEDEAFANLPAGKYVALLSHSGSRGFGATIANHYSEMARERSKLPKGAQHLAWLDMNTEVGQEYWISMNLAGAYAEACHRQIHKKLAKALGKKPIAVIENHHNFAWKESLEDGTEVIVHRKGATPAHKGVLGIIPASMSEAGYVVRGKGNPAALNSASHGAGRSMSRTKARNSHTMHEIKKHLKEKSITLIGGDTDEAPFVYKDIEKVMAAQTSLVDILASFSPIVVRMADAKLKRD